MSLYLLDNFLIIFESDPLRDNLPKKRFLCDRQSLLLMLLISLQTLYSSFEKRKIVHNLWLVEVELRFELSRLDEELPQSGGLGRLIAHFLGPDEHLMRGLFLHHVFLKH